MNTYRSGRLPNAAPARWGWRPTLEALKFLSELRALERHVTAARFGVIVPQEFFTPAASWRAIARRHPALP